ncbi:MAG: (2Fe-2S)-binding protein [Acidimicrobiales bacterium]|jgi:carbon-monoxide dehydrogenase small subunit|nr:(2Fe-2S)-binding protein [Acidimicrobiales bacterium]|tara:strand:- start:1187 stop:1666 length:480 start_codon:yes stop_codon:yes gene_type:complete
MTHSVSLTVNGQDHTLEVDGNQTLLETIREKFHLTGAKMACEEGRCGACTLLVNGNAVASCVVLVSDLDGATVTTIEGLPSEGELHPVQEAFLGCTALQCGYCTPGMILSSISILDKEPNAGENEVRRKLSGNICRCTGYVKIIDAIQLVQRDRQIENS